MYMGVILLFLIIFVKRRYRENKAHTGYRHTISGSALYQALSDAPGIQRPAIGKTLEPFAFQRGKPADEVTPFHDAFILTDILAADAFLISIKRAHHLWYGSHCVAGRWLYIMV